ncbi:MAG: LPS export ABC transporter periplasmic protein LptC [Desulfuromonadales bacterium]|nr:LPS export ABC transporter periplasmic protein LptC [Desulfuromonadales bacterium]
MSYFKHRNFLLILALGLALTLLVVIAMRYRPENQLQALVKALPKGVDIALQDIDYTHIEAGQARWHLVAQQVERNATSGGLDLISPHLNFFDKKAELQGVLQADKGEVSDDYQQIKLRTDVVLKNSAGYTIYTDRLDYDHATQIATTDAQVLLVSDDLRLEGTGMTFYLKTKQLKLHADVTAVLNPK